NRLARRYQTYWPTPEKLMTSTPGQPSEKLDTALQQLYTWQADAEPLVTELEKLQHESSELVLLQEFMSVIVLEKVDLSLVAQAGPALASQLYVLPAQTSIEKLPASLIYIKVSTPTHDFMLCIGPSPDVANLTAQIPSHQGRTILIPVWLKGKQDQALQELEDRLAAIATRENEIHAQLATLAEQHKLTNALSNINRLEWFMTHVSQLPVTENFAWVTGWTSDTHDKVLNAILAEKGVRGVVRFPAAPFGKTPPMFMQNPWWAQPFELFARLLGTPARDEVDPSRVLAIFVPLLFGYMFGDVGHGAVLLLAGIVLQKRWPLLRLLIANGLASILFGFVFGSVFGYEHIIEPLWVSPIEQPLPVLLFPLAGGVIILLLSLLLSGVEAYWRRRMLAWFSVEAAVITLYIGLIASIFTQWGIMLFIIGLVWYVTGSLLQAEGKKSKAIVPTFGLLLESVFQLIINTISFVRVGAFALAHAGLSLAFIVMADATTHKLTALIILIVGNIVVLALEGLVVTIQTTRLILFEFFIRFLSGGGRIFRPLSAPNHSG
ncbi:MAG: V-type ATPase 116kDa subunit family protein, partial [Thioalkalispiraceae bacterium]